MKSQPVGSRYTTKWNARWSFAGTTFLGKGAAAVALALCLGVGAYAQQGQPEQKQPDQKQQDEQMGPQQDHQQGQQQQGPQQGGQPSDQQPQGQATQDASKAKPAYPPQDADKPPYSRDQNPSPRPRPERMSQGRPSTSGASATGQGTPGTSSRPYQGQTLPETLTIPVGTILRVRMNDYLSSDKNQIGDRFTAELEQPVVVNGWVVARRGETLVGQVKSAKKAGRVKGTSELDLELTDLSVVDGKQMPILTQLWKGTGGTSHGADAATIAGGTGLGAAIGAAADWGTGAAIGAGAGAVAGIATVLLTRGRPTIVGPETELSFRLEDPVTVDTTQSQQAFLPVTQKDYDAGRGDHRRPRLAAGYPYPYPYYPYYPYGYYAPYYGPAFVGFYGGGWWGGRFRGGFRR